MKFSIAYLTYTNSDDALAAIQAGNGLYVDGRTLKCSLGTTKYCSRYLRDQECTLSDCMYLHEIADQEASFSKSDMNQGRHASYEESLMEDYRRRSEAARNPPKLEPKPVPKRKNFSENQFPLPNQAPKIQKEKPSSKVDDSFNPWTVSEAPMKAVPAQQTAR